MEMAERMLCAQGMMGVSGCGRQKKIRLRSTLNHGQTRDLDSVCKNENR